MIYFSCHSPYQANTAKKGGLLMTIFDFLLSLLISVLGSILGTLILQLLGW